MGCMMEINAIAATNTKQIANALLVNKESMVFQSSDMEEMRDHVSKVFKPHTLKLLKRAGESEANMHHVGHGSVSINQLCYQNEVIIDPGKLDDFFLLHIPVRGTADIRCGKKHFTSTPKVASLVSPTLPLFMRWETDTPQVILRLERERVERHCAQHLRMSSGKPVEFEPEFNLETPSGHYFMQLLKMLADTLTSPYPPLRYALAFEQFESTLINSLIYGQPSNLLLDAPVTNIAPYFVKRVEEFVQAHAAEPITIERLAELAGVSVRTLFAGFHRYRETSPMEYVRQVRLEHVHAELMSDTSGIKSVTDIALKWGFNHLGRFAIDYKRRFGESPSATLRFRLGERAYAENMHHVNAPLKKQFAAQ